MGVKGLTVCSHKLFVNYLFWLAATIALIFVLLYLIYMKETSLKKKFVPNVENLKRTKPAYTKINKIAVIF